MRITHLRQADLNLLVVFSVLAEERNVSRSAERLLLSQPAVTRALQRLRETFRDELLLRVAGSYELTAKGAALLEEVERTLPRLDRLLAGSAFDPATETAGFRLAGSDYASSVLGVPLARRFLATGPGLSFAFAPLSDGVFEAMDRGRLDLLLYADDGNVPAHLLRSVLFEEDFVCVVARDSPFLDRLTLEEYLAAPHVGVTTYGGLQTIPDGRLAAEGLARRYAFRVPFFEAAMRTVAGTSLIATVPRRLTAAHSPAWRVVEAPGPMGRFRYLMVWHARMEHDGAHGWLRQTVQALGASL